MKARAEARSAAGLKKPSHERPGESAGQIWNCEWSVICQTGDFTAFIKTIRQDLIHLLRSLIYSHDCSLCIYSCPLT